MENYQHKKESNYFQKSEIIPEENCFHSKSFMIQYFDEEIELNDIIIFRMEIDAYPNFEESDIFMEVELIGADISKIGRSDGDDNNNKIFKRFSGFKSKINFLDENKINGFHEYIPILFDENHFCLCNASLHCLLLDFRFVLNKLQREFIEKSQKNIILLQPKTFTEFLNKATHKCINITVLNLFIEIEINIICKSIKLKQIIFPFMITK